MNNKTYLILAGIIVVGGIWNYFRTGGGDPSKIVNNVNSDEMFKAVTQNPDVLILDARTPGEYASGKIMNATNIDYLNAGFESKLTELDKSKKYYVYCRSGQRSMGMGKKMKKMGFSSVFNLRGGVMSWNKPLEK